MPALTASRDLPPARPPSSICVVLRPQSKTARPNGERSVLRARVDVLRDLAQGLRGAPGLPADPARHRRGRALRAVCGDRRQLQDLIELLVRWRLSSYLSGDTAHPFLGVHLVLLAVSVPPGSCHSGCAGCGAPITRGSPARARRTAIPAPAPIARLPVRSVISPIPAASTRSSARSSLPARIAC